MRDQRISQLIGYCLRIIAIIVSIMKTLHVLIDLPIKGLNAKYLIMNEVKDENKKNKKIQKLNVFPLSQITNYFSLLPSG